MLLSQEPSSQGPAISQEGLEALRGLALNGAGDPTSHFLLLFRAAMESAVAAIDEAIASGNWAALKASAHGLKGACAGIGAHRLGERCRNLESVAALAVPHSLAPRYAEFLVELRRVRQELRVLLSAQRPGP